jgi:hypothetical protein
MPVTIEFDVSREEGNQAETDRLIRKNEGTIDVFEDSGPAGGNHCYKATFPTAKDAERFLDELYEEAHEGVEHYIVTYLP